MFCNIKEQLDNSVALQISEYESSIENTNQKVEEY